MVLYNALAAVVICAVAYAIGEWVSTATKAWVPSVFVSAVIFLVGYWTVFPYDREAGTSLGTTSSLTGLAGSIGAMLLVTHMGTIISIKQLAEQWKTIVICLAGLVGMCLFAWFICPLFMDKSFIIAGLPPLTGGIVAAQTMQAAALEKGLTAAAVFAIVMYCMQGFAGYPLTAVCLQKYGAKELEKLRSGEVVLTEAEKEHNKSYGSAAVPTNTVVEKKLIPQLPDKWNSQTVMIGKLALVAWLASLCGQIPFGSFKLSQMVWALILGVIFSQLGFLETGIMNRANSGGIIMFALMVMILDGLKDCTPEMLKGIIGPMIILIIIGVAGMAIFVFIISKVLKIPFTLALANSLTALYGFPPNAIITENTCKGLAANEDEMGYLMSKMYPSMIVGGFTTVTVTSVIIAGIFANFL